MAPAREDQAPALGDLLRKALHLSVAAIPVAYAWGAPRRYVLAVLGSGTLVALSLELARLRSPGFRRTFNRYLGPILKTGERESPTAAIWLWPSCFATALLLSRNAAVATLWCITAGDPSAALAGRAYRTWARAVPKAGKTLVGSAACFGVSFSGIAWLTHFPLSSAATIALVATICEHLPLILDDNLLVPMAAGITAWLLS